MGSTNDPRGFTLRDLMVAVAVIGLGLATISVLIPRTHSEGKRAQCLNNLRMIATAFTGYNARNQRLPNAVTIGDQSDGWFTHQIDRQALEIVTDGAAGNDTGHDLGPLRSWVVDILPDLDQQEMSDDWDRAQVCFSRTPAGGDPSRPSNALLSSKSMRVLLCANDNSRISGQGNLSYAVNMGFVRWAGVAEEKDPTRVWGLGWEGMRDYGGKPRRFSWGPEHYRLVKKTGVMFTGTPEGNAPWDMANNLESIPDGAGHTILVAEHSNGGASLARDSRTSPYFWASSGQTLPTNWATAHPNFVGFITSGRICAPSGDCSRVEDLEPIGGSKDGPGWLRANQRGSCEELNAARRYGFPEQGASPFANSEHPGGLCVGMCDGSVRFITDDINGAVWSKLITPDGESLPGSLRQVLLQPGDLP